MCSGIHGPWRGADRSSRKDKKLKDPLYPRVGGVSVFRRRRPVLAGAVIEEGLEDKSRGNLIDDSAMVLAGVAGGIEDLVCRAGGETLIPQVNGECGKGAEFGCKSLGLCGARALIAGKMKGISYHDPRDPEAAGEAGDGAEVFARVAMAVEGEDRLRGEAEFVRHGDADASGAQVKGEVADWRFGGQGSLLQIRPCDRYNLGRGSRRHDAGGCACRAGVLREPLDRGQGTSSEGRPRQVRREYESFRFATSRRIPKGFFASLRRSGKVYLNGMARRRSTNGRRRSGGGSKFFLFVLFLLVAGAAALAWLVLTPYGPTAERFVEVTPGSSSMKIGRELEKAGVVRSQYAFDAVRFFKRGTLKAGTYRFDHPIPAIEVYDQIRRGEVYTVAVTIPEGANIFDIAGRLEQLGFGPRQLFLDTAAQETSLITDLDPTAKTLEGYLFPDTYRFAPRTAMPEIAATMVKRFKTEAAQLGLSVNVHRTVTLASLVERETAVDGERPLVASVFVNRLDKKMPLMTDPSVIYGLELQKAYRGTIYASDLKRDTPYNTYLHAGLPPGPVANPGVKALRAAMAPAQTDYLYFVAAGQNPQGKSLFASTLEEHNRNVAGYREAVKKAGGR